MIKGSYSTLSPILSVNNDLVTLNGVTEKGENLFIHISDYGDVYFDISLCYKGNEKALANTGWDIIHISELNEIVEKLSKITGIQEVKKEKR